MQQTESYKSLSRALTMARVGLIFSAWYKLSIPEKAFVRIYFGEIPGTVCISTYIYSMCALEYLP